MGNSFSEFKKFWPAIVQWYPPKPKFNVDQIPDLTGRVVIVTGEYLSRFHVQPLPSC